jgi:hypothetical protein
VNRIYTHAEKNMKTTIPENFQVTDELRAWSKSKYGYYSLPQVFLQEFIDHHAAKGERCKNWERAFQNWINWSSPTGRFYNARIWEEKIERAKKLEYGNRQKAKPAYHPNQLEPTPDPKLAADHINNLRGILK